MYQDPSRAEFKSLLLHSSISVRYSTFVFNPYLACLRQAGLPAAAGISTLLQQAGISYLSPYSLPGA
jgi:hypothetical protein